jgi:hypothetical protein
MCVDWMQVPHDRVDGLALDTTTLEIVHVLRWGLQRKWSEGAFRPNSPRLTKETCFAWKLPGIARLSFW